MHNNIFHTHITSYVNIHVHRYLRINRDSQADKFTYMHIATRTFLLRHVHASSIFFTLTFTFKNRCVPAQSLVLSPKHACTRAHTHSYRHRDMCLHVCMHRETCSHMHRVRHVRIPPPSHTAIAAMSAHPAEILSEA